MKYRGELVNLTEMEGRGGHRFKFIGVEKLKRVLKRVISERRIF